MTGFGAVFSLMLPVFLVMGIGLAALRLGWLSEESGQGLLRLIVQLLYPALILSSVVGNPALSDPANLFWPPLLGFVLMLAGFAVAYAVGRWFGLMKGKGLRTFVFAAGIFNYGYIPIPIVAGLFGRETLGVLFVFNLGVEAAIWTVGIVVLAGESFRSGWKKLVNVPILAILAGVFLNFILPGGTLPQVVMSVLQMLGACAIPLALLLTGATLAGFLGTPRDLWWPRVLTGALLVRILVLPLLFLGVAFLFEGQTRLQEVLIVMAAMPAGMLPIVLAKHYGGQTLVAVIVVVATSLCGLLTIPLWIGTGQAWILP